MNKSISTIIILLSCLQLTFGQNKESGRDTLRVVEKPLLLASVSLSSSFERFNSIDFGILKTVSDKNAIGAEVGYIYNIQGLNSDVPATWYSEVNGIKTYFFYRFFFDLENNYPSNSLTFFDIEPQFYWASFNAERIGGFSCNDEFGDCEYYRFFDSRVDRFIPGLNIKLGKQYNYDPFFITLFGGLGYRYVFESSEIGNNATEPDKIFNTRGEISNLQTGGFLRLRLGVQLSYNLWH